MNKKEKVVMWLLALSVVALSMSLVKVAILADKLDSDMRALMMILCGIGG